MAGKIILFAIWILFGVINVIAVNDIIKKNRLNVKDNLFYVIGYFLCGIVGFLIITITNKATMGKWWIK